MDLLENALIQTKKESADYAAVNALCECLLTGLKGLFQYLLSSAIHQAATALDPRVKLSFTDHQRPGKVFVFSLSYVKLSIKSLIPPGTQPVPASALTTSVNVQPAKKDPGY